MMRALIDLRWRPVGPWHWEAPSGDAFIASEPDLDASEVDWGPLRSAIAQSAEEPPWRRAARHHAGG
eukprot:11214582-Lingulodinium_polyedra.AAC.1